MCYSQTGPLTSPCPYLLGHASAQSLLLLLPHWRLQVVGPAWQAAGATGRLLRYCRRQLQPAPELHAPPRASSLHTQADVARLQAEAAVGGRQSRLQHATVASPGPPLGSSAVPQLCTAFELARKMGTLSRQVQADLLADLGG